MLPPWLSSRIVSSPERTPARHLWDNSIRGQPGAGAPKVHIPCVLTESTSLTGPGHCVGLEGGGSETRTRDPECRGLAYHGTCGELVLAVTYARSDLGDG